MGHDGHFLSRLDRLDRSQTDFALALYRDHSIVRWVLDAVKVPDGADRVAIALSHEDDSPHVIVARDGGFVTCLGRGMSIGGRVRVERSKLDALMSEHHGLHARLRTLSDEDSTKFFLRKLRVAGPNLAREDLRAFVDLTPLLMRAYFESLCRIASTLDTHLGSMVRESRRARPDFDLLVEYADDYYFAEHLAVLVGHGARYLEPIEQEIRTAFIDILWGALGRYLLLSGMAKSAWVASKIGPVLSARSAQLLGGVELSQRLFGYVLVATLGACGEHDLRVRVRGIYESSGVDGRLLPMFDPPTTERVERARSTAVGWARERLRDVYDIDEQIPDDDPEHLVPALLGIAPETFYGVMSRGPMALIESFPFVVHSVPPESFYPPRRWLQHFRRSSAQVCRVMLLGPGDETRFKTQPIRRSAPELSRNDPCHCGSGKKFKKCCLP